MKRVMIVGALALALSGCSFYARSPDDYRAVTQELVQTRSSQLRSCYESEVAKDESAGGDVAVGFMVEAKTGAVLSSEVIPERTTASEPLQQCVLTALDGLVLDPPDQRTAQTEFVWTFERT